MQKVGFGLLLLTALVLYFYLAGDARKSVVKAAAGSAAPTQSPASVAEPSKEIHPKVHASATATSPNISPTEKATSQSEMNLRAPPHDSGSELLSRKDMEHTANNSLMKRFLAKRRSLKPEEIDKMRRFPVSEPSRVENTIQKGFFEVSAMPGETLALFYNVDTNCPELNEIQSNAAVRITDTKLEDIEYLDGNLSAPLADKFSRCRFTLKNGPTPNIFIFVLPKVALR